MVSRSPFLSFCSRLLQRTHFLFLSHPNVELLLPWPRFLLPPLAFTSLLPPADLIEAGEKVRRGRCVRPERYTVKPAKPFLMKPTVLKPSMGETPTVSVLALYPIFACLLFLHLSLARPPVHSDHERRRARRAAPDLLLLLLIQSSTMGASGLWPKLYFGSWASSTSAFGAASASGMSASLPLAPSEGFWASACLRASSSAAFLAARSASTLACTAWRSASTFSKCRWMMGPARARISSILAT